jgi:hypothetical protein
MPLKVPRGPPLALQHTVNVNADVKAKVVKDNVNNLADPASTPELLPFQ